MFDAVIETLLRVLAVLVVVVLIIFTLWLTGALIWNAYNAFFNNLLLGGG